MKQEYIIGSGNVHISESLKRSIREKEGVVPLGKELYCAYCRSKFYQQGCTTFYNNDGKQYITCPYCGDHKIYTGIVRKLSKKG